MDRARVLRADRDGPQTFDQGAVAGGVVRAGVVAVLCEAQDAARVDALRDHGRGLGRRDRVGQVDDGAAVAGPGSNGRGNNGNAGHTFSSQLGS